ncbi:MAG: helix-turn-helix domain-containing protein [Methylococcaceae bacterium]
MATTHRNISLNDDAIINTALAAILLDTPEKSLIKWRSTGEHNIPFLKIGRNVRYRTQDLRRWVESHVQGGDV